MEQKYGASLFIRAPVEIKWGIIQPELSSSGELNCKVLSLPGFPLILATRRELVAKRRRQMQLQQNCGRTLAMLSIYRR